MSGLGQDFRYAWRTLRKSRSFVFTAVVSLALGIGINTSVFSIIHTNMERPVSGRDPQQLVDLSLRTPTGTMFFSYPEYVELSRRSQAFSDLMAFGGGRYRIRTKGRPEFATAVAVSSNFFSAFGQQPALGRGFSSQGGEAVLTDGCWKRRFGADPAVIGRTLVLFRGEERLSYTIVGITPPDFRYTDMWTPDAIIPLGDDALLRGGKYRGLSLMGRVKPGISMDQARVETEALAGQLAELYPDSLGKARLNFWPKVRKDVRTRTVALVLQMVVALVLLIACANVMNLLLARHQARRAELATRLALGASRGRLVRQLLLESLALAVPSALAGYGLAVAIISVVEKLPIPGMPDLKMYFYLDRTVLGFAVCAGMAAALVAGLWPARAASRPDLVPGLKGVGPALGRKFGLRGCLVVGQLALSMVGITATVMLTKGVFDQNPFDPGVDPHKVLTATMWPAMNGYTDARSAELRRRLTDAVAKQAGVQAVAMAGLTPGADISMQKVIHTGSPLLPKQESVQVRSSFVGPGYFRTLGIAILRGREYNEADMSGRPLCLVNETMAKRFWPGQEPLGQIARVAAPQGEVAYEVIGVARNTGYEQNGNDYAPFLYVPVTKSGFATLIVRTSGKAAALGEEVRRTVASLDPDMPLMKLDPLSDSLIGGSAGTELRLRAGVFGTLAGTALLLSALGLYGVISYLVSRRTREIGIRLALGAGRVDVLRAVFAEGTKLVTVGMAAGVALSLFVSPLLTAHLFGVKPNQPGVIAGSCLLLALVAALAILAPARRACKVQALTALRYE